MTDQFVNKIYRFGKRYYRLQALAALLRFFTALTVMWLSAALADNLFYFSTITRWGLLFVNLFIIAVLFFRFVIRPFRQFFRLKVKDDLSFVARIIGRLYPEINDSLINAYQLITRKEPSFESQELRKAAVEKMVAQYSSYDFNERLRFADMVPQWPYLTMVLVVSILIAGVRFQQVKRSTLRLLNPGGNYSEMPIFAFTVVPGDTTIVKGKSLKITAHYSGPRLKECYVVVQHQSERSRSICTRKGNTFFAVLPNIQRSFSYYLEGKPLLNRGIEDGLKSGLFNVKVITLPSLRTLDVSLIPPGYTGLSTVRLERNIGDVAALPGTMVKIRGVANKPLARAALVFSYGDTLALKVRGTSLSGSFALKRDGTYHVWLKDTSGYVNQSPIFYQLSLLRDYPPIVEITRPGEDVEMTLDDQLPLTIEARDDFGLKSLHLYYRIVRKIEQKDTTWSSIPLNIAGQNNRQVQVTDLLDFRALPLAFGDQLKYFAQAVDNRAFGKKGIGRSRVYWVRFPSIEEVFQAVDEKQEEKIEELDDVVQQAKELKKSLKQLQRELKQTKKLDWEKKTQLERDLEKQKELQKKVEKIQKELDEAIKKLEKNNLIDEKILKKYMQLQDLFREVLTPELEQALKKLQKVLEKNANPREVEKALQQFRMNQQAFEQQIERTMELLKQVQLEQKMDELVKRAEALRKQQQKISEQLQKSDSLTSEERSSLERQQKEQRQQFERLQFDMNEVKKLPQMSKFPEAQRQLDSLLSSMHQQNLKQAMQQLERQMQRGAFQQAVQNSQQMEQQLAQMQQALQRAQQMLMQRNKQRIAQKMQQALRRLLELSMQQEKLYKKTQKTSQLSDQLNKIMREQGELRANLNRAISQITQLSRETFFVPPQMSKSLQSAARNMNMALQQLGERFKNSALTSQKKAMGALNRSAGQLMQAQQKMASSASGTGFEEFMRQLQQMAGQQGQLNQQTMSLFNASKDGKLSLQQQQAMRRIAAQQEALRQALEKMNEQMGERQDVLGRMGKVAQDMEKVVKDLLNQNLSRKTIERQQRILSRMLDAQKSIREREYSKKRQAEKAKKYLAHDPGKIKNIYDMDLKELQDALRHALQQNYSPDFKALIEAYFKQLIEQRKQLKQPN